MAKKIMTSLEEDLQALGAIPIQEDSQQVGDIASRQAARRAAHKASREAHAEKIRHIDSERLVDKAKLAYGTQRGMSAAKAPSADDLRKRFGITKAPVGEVPHPLGHKPETAVDRVKRARADRQERSQGHAKDMAAHREKISAALARGKHMKHGDASKPLEGAKAAKGYKAADVRDRQAKRQTKWNAHTLVSKIKDKIKGIGGRVKKLVVKEALENYRGKVDHE